MRSLPEVLESLEVLDRHLERMQREFPVVVREYESKAEAADAALHNFMATHPGPEWKAKAQAHAANEAVLAEAGEARSRYQAGKTLLNILDRRADLVRSELSALKSEMEVTRTGYGT